MVERRGSWGVVAALALVTAACGSKSDETMQRAAPTGARTPDEPKKLDVKPQATGAATAQASAAPQASGGRPSTQTPGIPQCAPNDPLCTDSTPAPKPGRARRFLIRAATTAAMGGRLTTAQVEDAIASNIDGFSSCIKSDTTVSMRAVIAGNGKVVEASSTRSTPDDARIRDCFADAFRRLTFPNGDGTVPITFDLVLSAPS